MCLLWLLIPSLLITLFNTRFECLKACEAKGPGCMWFSYVPESGVCQFLSDCTWLEETSCQDCVSGQNGCSTESEPICFVQGNVTKCQSLVKSLGNVDGISKSSVLYISNVFLFHNLDNPLKRLCWTELGTRTLFCWNNAIRKSAFLFLNTKTQYYYG
jgi:hypothetical protein